MVIGRGAELARIDRLLASARLGTSEALVITGEAGIGKTALLEYAVGAGLRHDRPAGRGRGVRVRDPVRGAPDPAAARAGTDRRAPAAAGRRAAGGVGARGGRGRRPLPDRRRHVDAAHRVRGAQSRAGRRSTTPSGSTSPRSAAILFAARRLLADALAIVVASRAGPFGLPELSLPGLDRATAAALLERHAGRPLPPGAADRAFEATLGNPLALVELAGSAAALPLEGAVPVRTTVEPPSPPASARCPDPPSASWPWPPPTRRATSA